MRLRALADEGSSRLAGLAAQEETVDEISLLELVQDVAWDLEAVAMMHGVMLVLDMRSRPLVYGSQRWLGRALANVVDNAIRHGPRRERVRIVVESRARMGRVEVHDGGAGVPPPWSERVFEPFVALAPGGDGLGLTVARAAVEAHGGHIRFVAGKHTIVRIELPCLRSCPVH
jgi:signal transduction histidine kinase